MRFRWDNLAICLIALGAWFIGWHKFTVPTFYVVGFLFGAWLGRRFPLFDRKGPLE